MMFSGGFPSKQDTLTQCCLNVGPLSATFAQDLNNFESTALGNGVLFTRLFEMAYNVQLYIITICNYKRRILMRNLPVCVN